MKKTIIKSPGGLWYSHWIPTAQHPLNRTAIVCIGGSAEYGSYGAADMEMEVSRITEKNGFAQDAANGEELPFQIISPLATKGKDIADHRLIATEIGNVVEALDLDYRILGGLSYGGQTTSGFIFQSKNGTEITQKLVSSFRKAELFNGFFMLAPKISWTPEDCLFTDKRVFMAHAMADLSIPLHNSFDIMDRLNACPGRLEKVYSNYARKYRNGETVYDPIEVPANAVNRLVVIPGGNHGTAWIETYKWTAPAGTPGYEFRKWVEGIAIPKSIDVPGKLVLRDGKVLGIFEDGTQKEFLTL
jgi:hypothetical protein